VNEEQIKALVELCNKPDPSKFTMMGLVGPIMEHLQGDGDVPDGILDLFPPDARRTMLMLFCAMMLNPE
jgi:hypothetical protein